MKIQGIIFDFDGTLIDSEPLWEEAKINLFASLGVDLSLEECRKTTGLPSYEAINYFYERIEKPGKEIALLNQELNQNVKFLMEGKGVLKEGVVELLDFCKSKDLPLGVASASSMALIKTIVDKFELKKYFNLIYSGDFERFGKPHPGVYISACKKLKIDPVYSLAFEDSFVGLLAAKSARMKSVAFLDQGQINDTKYDFSDLKIERFADFDTSKIEYLESIM